MNKINGMLLYVCVQESVKSYQEPGTPPKPNEWKASIAIADEDLLDEFEAYAKSIDAKISTTKVKRTEFEGKYKVAPPEGDGKNIWVLTFRKSVELGKTGKPVPDLYRPKVFEKVGNNVVEITNSKLVGNGSLGSISIEKFDRTNGTASLYLKNVLVTKLIEYTKTGSDYVPGSEFDDDASAPTPAATSTKNTGKAVKPSAADLEDDVPF